MDNIIPCLLKCIISSGILTAYYWFVLKDKKIHSFNRFYLLSSLIISLVVPFFNFRWYSIEQAVPAPVIDLFGFVDSGSFDKPSPRFDQEWILPAFLFIVSAILLMILIAKICRLYRIKRQHPNTRMNGFTLIETELDQAPFSFLSYLFWKKSISINDDNGIRIWRHELTHIEQKHTYDKLFSQIIVCFFWVNPFFWIIQRELNMVHEFIADAKTIEEGDTALFAQMLLRSYAKGTYLDPTHSFFHSPIKRRLIMITVSDKHRFSYLRRWLALPVGVIVFFLFSFTVVKAQTDVKPKQDSAERAKLQDKKHGELMDKKLRAALALSTEKARGKMEMDVKRLAEAIVKDPPDILYYLNGYEVSKEKIKKLMPEDLARLDVFTGKQAVERYGEKAQHGVLLLFTTR